MPQSCSQSTNPTIIVKPTTQQATTMTFRSTFWLKTTACAPAPPPPKYSLRLVGEGGWSQRQAGAAGAG